MTTDNPTELVPLRKYGPDVAEAVRAHLARHNSAAALQRLRYDVKRQCCIEQTDLNDGQEYPLLVFIDRGIVQSVNRDYANGQPIKSRRPGVSYRPPQPGQVQPEAPKPATANKNAPAASGWTRMTNLALAAAITKLARGDVAGATETVADTLGYIKRNYRGTPLRGIHTGTKQGFMLVGNGNVSVKHHIYGEKSAKLLAEAQDVAEPAEPDEAPAGTDDANPCAAGETPPAQPVIREFDGGKQVSGGRRAEPVPQPLGTRKAELPAGGHGMFTPGADQVFSATGVNERPKDRSHLFGPYIVHAGADDPDSDPCPHCGGRLQWRLVGYGNRPDNHVESMVCDGLCPGCRYATDQVRFPIGRRTVKQTQEPGNLKGFLFLAQLARKHKDKH